MFGRKETRALRRWLVIAIILVFGLSIIVHAEIAVRDGQIEYAWFSEGIGIFARESLLDPAVRGASVAVVEIAVVAVLDAGEDESVAACRLTDAVVAGVDGFRLAHGGTSVARILVVVVALLAVLQNAVAAFAFYAILAVFVAQAVRLDCAFHAAFAGFLAGFAAFEDVVAAGNLLACLSGLGAFPALLDAALDTSGGGVGAFVAFLVAGLGAVAAGIARADITTGGIGFAVPICLAFAEYGASVAVDAVAVVAFLGADAYAVAARFGKTPGVVAGISLFDLTAL